MRRSNSAECFAVLEAVFRSELEAELAYLALKPDEALKVKGLKVSSGLKGRRILFKVACRRGLMSLAYTLIDYLTHLKMIQEASSRLEEAKCP
ncbi:MAG: hypothetical protein QXU11_06580 [Thermoproteota archaeon]|nr:hypothetical protein [Candidatus Brockarchaeota archaeon]